MTNFEKYKDEIMKIQNYDFCFDGKKITPCIGQCEQCVFNIDDCIDTKIKWLYGDKMLFLSIEEQNFCEILQEGYITRDQDGKLYLSTILPDKCSYIKKWVISDDICKTDEDICFIHLNDNYFSFIKWENEEPWSIKKLLELSI